MDYYSGEIVVAVVHQVAQPQLLAGGRGMYRNTDLERNVTFPEISAT